MEYNNKSADNFIDDDLTPNSEKMRTYLYSLRKMAESNMDDNKTYHTELLNLRAFFYKSNELIYSSDKKYAIIIMDIANFKTVNEFCGRVAADGLLKFIADCFRVYEHEDTAVAHFRADIFAICTPYETEEYLINIVQDIAKKIDNYKINTKILPAFGICDDANKTFLSNNMADYAMMALNTIKGKFYSNYIFFDEKMKNQMLIEKHIENDIVNALKNNQFKLYIQPKVDMNTKKIIGGEALVRWQHPERGIIPPSDFIPVLEKNGFIIDVDIYIWTEVFKLISTLLKNGEKAVPISVNVSRVHAFDKSFRETLCTLPEIYGVPTEMVHLELTESIMTEGERIMFNNMEYLKEKGYIFSMDDFGIGYSSMNMLVSQPVDEVKIDRSFLHDIENKKSKIIISNTIKMLKELDAHIIAEGVETKEQQDFLINQGCSQAQGYYYYRPMPAEDFKKLLGQGH